MKKTLLLFATCVPFMNTVFGQSTCADTLNIFSFSYNGSNYEVVKEVKNWTAASACAVSRGGHLVEINTSGEQAAVYSAITTGAGISSTYASVADGGGAAYVWIGATDRHVEGTWLWDGNYDNAGINFWTGQGNAGAGGGAAVNSSYINWGDIHLGTADEPDDYLGIQDCGAMALGSWPYGIAGEWNDISGLNTLYYVIEYDSALGVHEQQMNYRAQFYPNPVSDLLHISVSDPSLDIEQIEIYNELGALIYSEEGVSGVEQSIDVSNLENGFYFVQILFANGEAENRKAVVLH